MFTLKTVAHDGSFNFQSVEGLHFQPATRMITYQVAGSPVGRADNGYLFATLFNSEGKHIETMQGPPQGVPDTVGQASESKVEDKSDIDVEPDVDEPDEVDEIIDESVAEDGNIVPLTEEPPAVPPEAPGLVTSTPR